jgi:hypothetical protein
MNNCPAAIALLTLLASTAAAQQYIPSEEEKVAALKRAFHVEPVAPEPKKIFTERIAPDEPRPNPVKVAVVKASSDICTRNHMHRVIRGNSWRCKR